MKKTIVAFAIAASFLVSCNGTKSVNLEPVAEPSWYHNQALFEDLNGLYEEMPIYSDNIVLVGDDVVADGYWNEFFNDTTIKNRGIAYDGTEHVLYRIDRIAAAKPAKIFVSVGSSDAAQGRDSKETAARIEQIFDRISKISPDTRSYFLSICLNGKGDEINTMVKDASSKGGFEYVDLSSMREKIDSGEYSHNDGKNLNAAGYEALAQIIANYIGDTAQNKAVEGKEGRASILYSLPETENKFAFVGDEYMDNIPWSELFPFSPVISRAVAGDDIDAVKARVDELYADNPSKIFLMVGANDINGREDVQVSEVWSRYEALIKEIKTNLPETTLYINSIIPAVGNAGELNKLIQAGQERYGYFYIDLGSILCDETGNIAQNKTTDGIHLNTDGYFVWATELIKGARFVDTRGLLLNQ